MSWVYKDHCISLKKKHEFRSVDISVYNKPNAEYVLYFVHTENRKPNGLPEQNLNSNPKN